MNSNISCISNGLSLTNDAKLNCNGYSILGSGSGNGLTNDNSFNLIEGCVITNFENDLFIASANSLFTVNNSVIDVIGISESTQLGCQFSGTFCPIFNNVSTSSGLSHIMYSNYNNQIIGNFSNISTLFLLYSDNVSISNISTSNFTLYLSGVRDSSIFNINSDNFLLYSVSILENIFFNITTQEAFFSLDSITDNLFYNIQILDSFSSNFDFGGRNIFENSSFAPEDSFFDFLNSNQNEFRNIEVERFFFTGADDNLIENVTFEEYSHFSISPTNQIINSTILNISGISPTVTNGLILSGNTYYNETGDGVITTVCINGICDSNGIILPFSDLLITSITSGETSMFSMNYVFTILISACYFLFHNIFSSKRKPQ